MPEREEAKGVKKDSGRGRASLSSSPLARPTSLIHVLASRVQDYIYFPTPDPLYVVLGTVAANMMKGVPVWTVMVGAPSAGKGVMLEALATLPRIHIVGAFKGPSALLSGVAKKDSAKNATGGLLRQIGTTGMMVMKDFTSMLSLPREPLGESIGALREIFDGRYSRPLGSEGGKVLEWTGKIGFLAACTPTIDRHSSMIGDLGERWIYYRYDTTDGYGETIKALGVNDPTEMMNDLRDLVSGFIDALELVWDDGGTARRTLEKHEKDRLYAMSSLVCAARSGVPREQYHPDEVSGVASREAPPRIAGELGQLYLGFEKIGLEEAERWRLIEKVALDSIPQLRTLMLLELNRRGSKTVMKPSEFKQMSKCGMRTVQRTLEDLTIHGVVQKSGNVVNRMGNEEGVQGGFVLTDWAKKQLQLGWGR